MTDEHHRIDSAATVTVAPGVGRLRARLLGVIEDLRAGRITATEANRMTKDARRELQDVEAALRVAKIASMLGDRR